MAGKKRGRKPKKATTKKTETKRGSYQKKMCALVEVVESDAGTTYISLPLPDGCDPSNGRRIISSVKKAIKAGNTAYDDKVITVITFSGPVKVESSPVVTKRRVKLTSI